MTRWDVTWRMAYHACTYTQVIHKFNSDLCHFPPSLAMIITLLIVQNTLWHYNKCFIIFNSPSMSLGNSRRLDDTFLLISFDGVIENFPDLLCEHILTASQYKHIAIKDCSTKFYTAHPGLVWLYISLFSFKRLYWAYI